jgi:1,4-alpha-glucan branching enzyme
MYFYDENFVLPLSHDEVVHGKSPMIYKMPGDEWQKFANLRLLYTYMFTHPGAKLMFMGNEFAQTEEWNYKTALRWDLLQYDCHKGMKACVSGLANLLKNEPAIYEMQFETDGFEWLDLNHRQESVISYKRKSSKTNEELIVVLNMTPIERLNWKIETDKNQEWLEIFNSDDKVYWGTGNYMNDSVLTPGISDTETSYQVSLNLPPLGGVVLKRLK